MQLHIEEAATITDKMEGAASLMYAHWQELATYKQMMRLNPDVDRYRALERTGLLLALFAYDGEEIVGYSVSILAPHLHYAELVYAHNDVLYLSPEYRGVSRLGLGLIRSTEQAAKRRGAQLMLWQARPDTTLATLLPKIEYGVQDIVFSKEL